MVNRRQIVFAVLGITGFSAVASFIRSQFFKPNLTDQSSGGSVIKSTFPLGLQFPTQEPFLFCAHHLDFYPRGNNSFGPDAKHFKGRNMGQDFEEKDGFRMYHGEEVPGFPVHPHRGFETITVVRRGYVDHADSLGAAGRYGEGDVQWMTAGAGVQHSEMFPLLHKDKENPVELFQIWLNLPRKSKMVPAHFKMFWSEDVPRFQALDGKVTVNVIAGAYNEVAALTPPPDSWAFDANNEVLVLLVKVQANGVFKLSKSKHPTTRSLYFFEGSKIDVNGTQIKSQTGAYLDSNSDLVVTASESDVEFLVLQARPIGEPTFQHGPFVMNTREDIIRTIEDYQRTEFGGWSWPRHDMVHGSVIERFAKYPNGKIEKPKGS